MLILEVLFNLASDIIYKHGRFSETLSKKSLEFVPGERGGPILFFLYLVLPLKVDSISKKQGCKKDAFRAHGPSYFELVLALSTELITFPMQVFIIEVKVSSFKGSIARCEVCLAISLALEK